MTQREMQLPALWTLVSFAKNSGFHPEYDGDVSWRTKARFPFLLFIYLFIYLFMAVLGLRFCARVFSSCGERGPLLHRGARASHCCGLSCCRAQAPDAQAQ